MENTRNNWQVGATVRVGFLNGLHVHEKVASPGNFRPDGFILSRGEQVYAFVPHNGGIVKCASFEAARQEIKS